MPTFGILGVDLFEDIDLEFGGFAVFLHAFDDLDGDFGSLSARSAVMIHHLRHFAKRAFAQMTNHFVSENEKGKEIGMSAMGSQIHSPC